MMGTERGKTTTNIERSKEMYEILAEAIESEPKKELAMGELFEYAEELGGDELRRLTETIGGKALMRAEATEFREAPPSGGNKAQIEDELSPEDLNMVPRERIYACSYELTTPEDKKSRAEHQDEGETRGDLSSIYTMYVEDETGVPVCACPEIARGGAICHHMMLHAVRFGSDGENNQY